MNKKKAKLFAQIMKCKTEIDNLELDIDKSEKTREIYYKKLIEKAVLTKELKEFDDHFILKLVKNIIPKQEKTISDYFVKPEV